MTLSTLCDEIKCFERVHCRATILHTGFGFGVQGRWRGGFASDYLNTTTLADIWQEKKHKSIMVVKRHR